MKRSTLLNSLLLLAGILLGGFAMWIVKEPQVLKTDTASNNKMKIVEVVKTDTLIVKEKVFITTSEKTDTLTESKQITDTLNNEPLSDSLQKDDFPIYDINSDTNFTKDDIVIIKEQLILSKLIEVSIKESDSLSVEEAFDLKQVNFAEHIVLEFWESPLELTGYELGRNKLKLFGFDPTENIKLSHSVDSDLLEVQIGNLSLHLQKTSRFKTLYL